MEEQICCFTGHRVIPSEEHLEIVSRLGKAMDRVLEQGIRTFCVGGALGFDTLAAVTVLFYKQFMPEIKLILILPCKTQTRGWKPLNIKTYEEIKQLSDEVIYVSEEYTRSCMFERNRKLVDMSTYCICYLTKATGGTAYTVKYAKKKNLQIINIGDTAEAKL